MPPQCVFFFDVLINIVHVKTMTVHKGDDGMGVLHVAALDEQAEDIPIGVPYDRALTEWRGLFGRAPQHTDDGHTHARNPG